MKHYFVTNFYYYSNTIRQVLATQKWIANHPLRSSGLDHIFTISNDFILFSLLNDVERNGNFKGRIIYTPMHGVGASYIDRAFQVAGFLPVIHVKEQKGTKCYERTRVYGEKSKFVDTIL